MPRDKSIESQHFKFFRLKEAIPDGPVTHSGAFGERAPAEAPDFVIHGSGHTLGIEHREVLVPTVTQERAQEGFEDEILAMAREFTELRGTPVGHVSVGFARGLPSNREQRIAMARALSALVHEHLPSNDSYIGLDYSHFIPRNIDFLRGISMYRGGPPHWAVRRGGWVMSDCVDVLQTAIDDKAGAYSRYRTHCDECWLLLVADTRKPSSILEPDERSRSHEYRSPFERTYLLEFGMGKLHRLQSPT